MIALFHSKKKATSDNRSNWAVDERWFIDRMQRPFQTNVPIEGVSYKAHSFAHKDIDDSFYTY